MIDGTKEQMLDANARGEGCLGRSQNDEPVFLLCARDPVAAKVIRDWADDREMLAMRTAGLDAKEQAKIRDARIMAMRFETYYTELVARRQAEKDAAAQAAEDSQR